MPETPPRDDPAMRPRLIFSPRHIDGDVTLQDSTRAATKHACGITVMAVVVFILITMVFFGLFAISNWLLGKQVLLRCSEQPIENGILQAGTENATAQLLCHDGYALKVSPKLQLKCQLIWEKCMVLRRATVREEAVEKCTKDFAYVGPHDIEMRPLDTSGKKPAKFLAQVRTKVYKETLGVCVLKGLTGAEENLWGLDRSRLTVVENAHTWSSAKSSLCLISLAVVSICLLLASSLTRPTPQDYRLISVANEPDADASLLGTDGEPTFEEKCLD